MADPGDGSGRLSRLAARARQTPERPAAFRDDDTLYYDDHVLIGRQRVETWARITPTPYAFRRWDDRYQAGRLATLSLAALRAGNVRIKTVHLPRHVGQWGREQWEHAHTTGDPIPDYAAVARAQQAAMRAAQPADKHTLIGVQLGTRSIAAQVGTWARHEPLPPVTGREIHKWQARAEQGRAVLARGAFAVTPLPAPMLRQIRRYTIGRGPVPVSMTQRRAWGQGETACEFDDYEIAPGLRWVRVDGPARSTYTATLVCSAFPVELWHPDAEPWLGCLDRLDFVAESDLLITLTPATQAKSTIRRKLLEARDQDRDAARAGADLPLETAEMLALARTQEWSITRRRMPLAYGWARIRIDGDSPAELRERYAEVAHQLGQIGGEAGIDVAWPGGWAQVDLHAESLPGAWVRHKSWRQRWLLETVGCALPQVASGLSDGRGPYRGWSTGRVREAWCWSQHDALLEDKPGGTLILGNQGAGKSSALGQIIFDETTAGRVCVSIEGSGSLAAITQHPWIKDRVQVVNLSEAADGTCDPMTSAVIPDPDRALLGDPGSDAQWRHAQGKVRAERFRLSRSALTMLAWRQLRDRPDGETGMLRAIDEVLGDERPRLYQVIDRMVAAGDASTRYVGEHLRYTVQHDPDASMLFGDAPALPRTGVARTTMLTMPGIVLPRPGVPTSEWQPDEQVGAARLLVAAYFARRLLWDLPANTLKTLVVDEGHVLLGDAAGRRVLELAIREGRRKGLALVLATHQAVDLGASEVLANGFSTRMLFRSQADLDRAFTLLDVEDTPGNRAHIRGFRNGECLVVNHWDVRDRVRWDRNWAPGLASLLDTTPTGQRVEVP